MDTKKILELFNTAMDYKNRGEYEKAASYYEEVLKITDILPEVYFNLAFVYDFLDRFEDVVKCFERYVELEPEDYEGHYFLATAYFKVKNYEKGFAHFESRISRTHAVKTQEKLYGDLFTQIPFWQGEDLSGKTIYVYYEAGLGDTLMYHRYIKLLAQRAKRVYFKPQVTFIPLFAQNRDGARIIMNFTPKIAAECDYQCSIMSLPYYLGLNNETIFYRSEGFITPVKRTFVKYKKEYFMNDKLKIGIKWQGNTLIGAERAITAQSFAKIFEIPNSKIYSVQVMGGSEQIDDLIKKYNMVDLGCTFKNFSDTASAMQSLDIVICNDTSVAHLAGALGKRCYVILPKVYDWRWHADISKCEWYDSIKLFRQKTTWEEVIQRIYNDIMSIK